MRQHGKASGEAVQKGAEDATDAHAGLASAMRRVNVESMALSAGKQMLDMITQGAIDSAREIQKMAQTFIELRDRARELAGVLGKSGNVDFTKEQLGFAAETGFSDAGKAVDFRTAFQGEANQYAGRFKDANEFAQFEKEAARLGNQNNVPADVMAKIAGMAIRTGPKEGQTSASQMQRLGGSFKTMMAGSGAIGELAGQLGRMSGMVGEGNAFPTMEEAAVSTRMSAETNLPEAYTEATEIRTGVIELSTDEKKAEKAKALGITPETSNFQAIKSLSEAQKASGQNMDVFLGTLFPMKKVRDSYRNAINAYRNNVMAAGLKDAAAVTEGQTEAGTAKFFADPLQGGMLSMEKAKTAQAEAEVGEDTATIAPFMQAAKTRLTPVASQPGTKLFTKFMDESPLTAPMRWMAGMRGQGYQGLEQYETAGAMKDIRGRAEAAGIDTSDAPDVMKESQSEVTSYMAMLVRLTQEANEYRRKGAEKPLVAQPPSPATR